MGIYNILCGLGKAFPPGTLVNTQEFTTAGSHTWTKPDNATYAEIEIWGGGGSGGSAYNGNTYSQGGEGGSYKKYTALFTDMDATEEVLVGAGGSASISNGYYGNPGGFSWFGRAVWAIGGYGGRGQFTSSFPASSYTPTVTRTWTLDVSEVGGAGGYGTVGGNTTNSGAGGGTGYNGTAGPGTGGNSTNGGDGGLGDTSNSGAFPGAAPGGGGGGGVWTRYSGAGGAGRIVVKSYA